MTERKPTTLHRLRAMHSSGDMLGITGGKLPRFVRHFMAEGGRIGDAVRRYVAAVKDGSFPDEAVHGY